MVGLSGTAVGIITVLLAYRERIASYRQELYAKQVGVCADIMDTIASVTTSISDQNSGNWKLMRKNLHTKFSRWRGFLPTEVLLTVLEYMDVVEDIARFRDSLDGLRDGDASCVEDGAEYYADRLSAATLAVIAAVRKNLGVDPLTKDALRLIRKLPCD